MPLARVKFFSEKGKRLVFVIAPDGDDREQLKKALNGKYEVMLAANDGSTLSQLREHRENLSLTLLRVPAGFELLREMKKDAELCEIPVIAITDRLEDCTDAVRYGADDVILMALSGEELFNKRVDRTIEISEMRTIIDMSERDHLTGLYNREFFYSYAEQYDRHHPDTPMDAIVLDVNNFHSINERYGKAYGDDVLRRIGRKVRDIVHQNGGIVCRSDADLFLIYCPHIQNYEAIMKQASMGLAGNDVTSETRIRLRMGVYSDVDRSIDMERRFDRAKNATKKMRNGFNNNIAVYNSALHEAEMFEEQLLEDFHDAITQRQFKVYYQPKFDIRGEKPVLASAEALVRWQHPKLGTLLPFMFVPLFESRGMIHELDLYVWDEAAAQIRAWRDQYGVTVPISVNVSRIDLFVQDIVATVKGIIGKYDLSPADYLLEITESAYTEDSDSIISTVKELREAGFKVEMDDFGTGYSSLSMVYSLPIDAVKLDMSFTQNAFRREEKDLRMLELVMEIADHLSVPVIAEGIETREQMLALREMGCAYAQGYYFSKPAPAKEISRFVEEKRDHVLMGVNMDA